MGIDDLIDSRIREAMEQGAFDNLPGAGKPLAPWDDEALAGENWMGFKVLRQAGMLPPWLELGREIERDLERLEAISLEHRRLVERAAQGGDWRRFAPAIRERRDALATLAYGIRKKQEQFNFDAPGHRSQRPPIWVEHHLEKLDARLIEAGAPSWVGG